MKRTILIIGAQGMLGQELAQAFNNEQPQCWDREQLDITDQAMVTQKIRELRPNIVLNAAAYNDVDGAEKSASIANFVNGEAPGYLAQAVDAVGGILVHYSTEYVFRGNQEKGYTEADQPDPQSAYGRSKYRGEQRVRERTQRYYIIRLSRLFGKPGIGESGKKSFVHKILERAQTNSVVQAIDEEVSCPTYAPDLAVQSKYIVDSQLPFGTYHVTNIGSCTWFGFAQEIFKLAGVSAKLAAVPGSVFPRPAVRPAYGILINTKLPAMRSWQTALAEFISHGI
ncbi:MAG: dTDP-4-dehydrorhamnose reductase [Candidatus Kerfeldbacteria bacterium]|nr:dTDP-4-dehydrorhamnose reductase [Candidatus Kerfeldbacteria bacterium]